MAQLHQKYDIKKTNGNPVDPEAQYFVLRIDTDPAARLALQCYADNIEYDDPDFAKQLREWIPNG